MRTCLRCKQEGEFGRDKARPDGLNVYCKQCNRETVYARRLEVREIKPREPVFEVEPEVEEVEATESALRPELVSCFQRTGDRRVHGWH